MTPADENATTYLTLILGIVIKKSSDIGIGKLVPIKKDMEKYLVKVSQKNVYKCEIVRRNGISIPFTDDIDPKFCAPEQVKTTTYQEPGSFEDISPDDENQEEEKVIDDDTSSKPGTLWQCPTGMFIFSQTIQRMVQN